MDKEEYRKKIIEMVERIESMGILEYLFIFINMFLERNRDSLPCFFVLILILISF